MATPPIFSYEVTTKDVEGLPDARGNSIKAMLASNYGIEVGTVRVILGYQVRAEMTNEDAQRSVFDLFADPVIEEGCVNETLLDNKMIFPIDPQIAITTGFKPGVTDNAAQAGLDGLLTIFPSISERAEVATSRSYLFWGVP